VIESINESSRKINPAINPSPQESGWPDLYHPGNGPSLPGLAMSREVHAVRCPTFCTQKKPVFLSGFLVSSLQMTNDDQSLKDDNLGSPILGNFQY
jgi:hypothetical protein